MLTRANLAIHLLARRQRLGRWEDWRFAMEDDRVAARRWLLDRLPPELARLATPFFDPWNPPLLEWDAAGKALLLQFETPHAVRWNLFDLEGLRDGQTSGPPQSGTFNLGLDLTEITDMIRNFLGDK